MSAPTPVRLLIACPDRRGIVAHIAGVVADCGGNVVDADQHTEPARDGAPSRFFMRLAFDADDLTVDRAEFTQRWSNLCEHLGEGAPEGAVEAELHWPDRRPRVALLGGPQTHCLADLLWRQRSGELPFDPIAVISNREAPREPAELLGVPFHLLEVDEADRPVQEHAVAALLEELSPDLIVLARYMRVLPDWLVERYPHRIINIHHSFLPAFAGARPYHQAFDRGVKLIGATSHYVTADLDQGPIIAQETAAVTHRHGVDDLVRLGRDLERLTLARAVRLHLERRVIVDGARTIVFD